MKNLLMSSIIATGLLMPPVGAMQSEVDYVYDDLGRLIRVDYGATGQSVDYTYDAAGNRTTVTTVAPAGANPGAFSINDVSGSEGGVLSFTISKSDVGAASVNYATANGTATSGSDYTPVSGTLSFAEGQTSKTLSVTANTDTTMEGTETFYLDLSAPSGGATITDNRGVGTIANVGGSAPSFSVNNASVSEGGTLTFTVSMNTSSGVMHNIAYATSNSSASAGSDYVGKSGTLSFAPGETSKTVTVSTIEDTLFENNETLHLGLSNADNGATIGDAQGNGTINNDDSAPGFAVSNTSVSEGGNLAFTVSLSAASANSHNVSYATANSSAVAGSDYTAKSGTLSFTPGQTSKNVTVSTLEEGIYENDETMRLDLSNATGSATITDSQGTGTINNDDAAPGFAINNVTKVEGQNLTFTIAKTGSTAKTHSVNYATANSSASAGSDYVAKSGTATFTPNQSSKTITIVGVQDSDVEPTETFQVNLTSPTAGAVVSDSQGIGSITNDDVANSPPNAVNDTYFNVSRTSWVTFQVRANDSDPEGNAFTVTSVTTPGGQQVQINPGGFSVKYRCGSCGLSDGFFNYTITDSEGGTGNARVTVNFSSGGLPPF